MSENREVYRDPDYSQFQSTHTDGKLTDNSPETKSSSDKSPEGRIATIRRIIEREFQTELTKKEKESEEINKRLEESKKLLAKVRYAVVNHYYNQKHLLCTEDEVAAVYKMQQDEMVSYPAPGNKPQMAIHPSLKKLLGSKRPIDYNEILKIRPTRKAAQNATEQFHKMKKKPAETRIKMAEPMIKDEAEPQAVSLNMEFFWQIVFRSSSLLERGWTMGIWCDSKRRKEQMNKFYVDCRVKKSLKAH